MGKVYINQTDLEIKVITGKNLTGITNTKIIIKLPDGTQAELEATVSNATTGEIKHIFTTPLSIPGTYNAWAKITNLAGLISIGEPFQFIIYNPGS